jgi:hypothetical protein
MLAVAPTQALATVLFGALTEAGLAVARGDVGEADALAAFELLLDGLTTSDPEARTRTTHRRTTRSRSTR